MTIQTRAYQSGNTGHSSPSAGAMPGSGLNVDKVYTHEEVFGDITIGPFSLDDALEY